MPDQPTLTPFAQDAMLEGVAAIAAAIAADDWRPDYLVGLGRGGLVPATYLSHARGTPMLSLDLSSGVPAFAEALIDALAELARGGKRLLVIDDINDSGGTIARVRDALAAAGAPATHVRFATLIDNIRSSARVDYRFRTIDRAVVKDWFVFPWEAVAPTPTLIAEAGEVPERLA